MLGLLESPLSAMYLFALHTPHKLHIKCNTHAARLALNWNVTDGVLLVYNTIHHPIHVLYDACTQVVYTFTQTQEARSAFGRQFDTILLSHSVWRMCSARARVRSSRARSILVYALCSRRLLRTVRFASLLFVLCLLSSPRLKIPERVARAGAREDNKIQIKPKRSAHTQSA